MKIEYRVDTYNTTHDYNVDVLSHLIPTLYRRNQSLEQATPQRGYSACWRVNPAGLRVNWHDEIVTQGLHYQYGGKALEWYAANSIKSTDVVKWHHRRGGRTSRIDIAIDLYDSNVSWKDLERELPNAKTRARKAEIVRNQTGAGWTQYVGSRSGERFLRIYDKTAQVNDPDHHPDHVRIELEIKGRRAKQFTALLVDAIESDTVYALFCAEICAYCDFESWQLWQDVMGAKIASQATQNHKKSTDTVKWLIEQVAPVLAREYARDESVIALFEQRLWDEYDEITEDVD